METPTLLKSSLLQENPALRFPPACPGIPQAGGGPGCGRSWQHKKEENGVGGFFEAISHPGSREDPPVSYLPLPSSQPMC